ncbi:MAG TPA: GDSL-type esterase/lipase family protein [Spirochaetota bacterium]|nr:GDSL-type esterase/lipase family protein [Spirochaetota bacterium]HPJ34404.1 GDSL-type esterase/lipase family protein [Spirochaetota bacterium]
MHIKKIFCFGDSNTWGCNAIDSSRFDETTRWPKVLEALSINNFSVIEEGLNGRTLLALNPENREAGGVSWIQEALTPHIPADIIIIALGMNDVFDPSEVSLAEIGEGMKTIIRTVRAVHLSASHPEPEIILMGPPAIDRNFDGAQFFEMPINKMIALGPLYNDIAEEESLHFFDASLYIKTSGIDCSHINGENHRILGREIARFIMEKIP